LLGWIIVEWIRDGKPTMVGASSGAVAGLVAITPACGFIQPYAAVLLGLVAGALCALAVSLKYRFRFDDSLDVVGVHFVGGWVGSLWIGLFASIATNPNIASVSGASNGLFLGGGLTQLGRQAICSGIVTVFSFSVAAGLGWLIDKTVGFRASPDAEVEGIDLAEHAESAYDLTPVGGSGGGAFALAGITASKADGQRAEPADKPAPVSVEG
jgi:Amt family ammonium transporter